MMPINRTYMEEWRDIPGYPGYQASNSGKVRSLPRIAGNNRMYGGKLLRQRSGTKNSPYLSVYLGKPGNVRVHHAVLLAFVGPCPDGMVRCHNNGKKLDNRLENLRYDTQRSNQADRVIHKTDNRGERHGRSKLSDTDVRVILNAAIDLEHKLADEFGVSHGCIRHVLTGRRWKFP